jgi:amino acid adenylation domain-containing protein
LLDLLSEQVRAQPERTAVKSRDGSLTYRELMRLSSAVGARLRALGVGRDDCVGLFVEPSLDLMVGVWGILSAGAAYLPLSTEYPEERLRYMIANSQTRVILCQEPLKYRLAGLTPPGTTIVTVEQAQDSVQAVSRIDGPSRRPRGTDLAYVIYTSGSTGQPKGVMIEQGSIISQMRWMQEAYDLGPDSVVLQKTSMSFDAAQWEILAPCCGATVVMGTPGIHRDPEQILQMINLYQVTTLQCVPTLLRAILEEDELGRARSLTRVFCGGEALSRSLARHCLRALPGCTLVNLYGPTECTINSSAFTVDSAALEKQTDTISIGTPVRDTEYHILTPERQPVERGAVGELYISGVQLARGYLGRPDLTRDRFVPNPFSQDVRHDRLYRTGDLVYQNADGSIQFAGRADNQVKLRGFRIELDEIRLAIENHDWIRHAGVIVKADPASGAQSLVAFIELDPAEAALMDQGNHSAHHQSKASKLQLKAQLANLGCRSGKEISGRIVIDLPGTEPSERQRRTAFARKTYRFFEGAEVTKDDILLMLERATPQADSQRLSELHLTQLGEILRYFGQYRSPERLLPKYAYASPGALYATQMYLEVSELPGLAGGYYYYHPVHHQLVRVGPVASTGSARLKVHFVGKTRAIRLVYQNNVHEVLRIEAGHMVGLFEERLPAYGLGIRADAQAAEPRSELECADDDLYLGGFEVVPSSLARAGHDLDIYVQAHPGQVTGLPAGQYLYQDGDLRWVSDERILRRDVIAINQRVYDRASFGISLVSRQPGDWMSYVVLGSTLQRLMMNEQALGFMSSGYSSETGFPLPSAKRIGAILDTIGRPGGPFYFALGGKVSQQQLASEGMKEDAVHMKGPAEMVKDDLGARLPRYMVPDRVTVLDRLPLTANGKVDTAALAACHEASVNPPGRPFVAPRTPTEERICAVWAEVTKQDQVSVDDDFFESGGNSLMAVSLVNRLSRAFGCSLPLQILFEAPTVAQLAPIVESEHAKDCSRLICLNGGGSQRPVFCWPGLGGYPMNLRLLAVRAHLGRPLYGVQAHGINEGETPYSTTAEMAAADVNALRCLQPEGPYTLWGYSFGARVAFETAHQLEQAGEQVDHLFLIAPGSPKISATHRLERHTDAAYRERAYRTILYSVFAGSITDEALEQCLATVTDDASFAAFMTQRFTHLDGQLVRRIMRIVRQTYEFEYTFAELAERQLEAPITIFKARGDDYSFLESHSARFAKAPTVIQLDADHYGLLKEAGVAELATMIRHRLLVDAVLEVETASRRAS